MKAYQPKERLLQDRVILITGASSGIGRAIAVTCAQFGATVILLGKQPNKLTAVYDQIVAAKHPQPAILPVNLESASPDDYAHIHDVISKEFGHLDGLLHNAAILGSLTPIEHYPIKQWYQVTQVNLHAPFLLTQALLPLLKSAKDSSLVFTSADVGQQAKAYWGAYAISKFGTQGLAQILSHELSANTTIRVNTINPKVVRTKIRAQAYPAEDSSQHPNPEDIVASYLYLLGPDSTGITGQHFEINNSRNNLDEA